jgi:hypothetical protein
MSCHVMSCHVMPEAEAEEEKRPGAVSYT